MKPSDRALGLGRKITRRDFVHDVGVAAIATSLPLNAPAAEGSTSPADYPPVRTGLRGSHPGAFETAHALAREGRLFADVADLDEHYDLVVVGGGLSGLAAAYFHRRLHGPASRILILDNHDDFGGHAKRNEFHQGGAMRLAWGGTVNIEYPMYSEIAAGLLKDLGIDIPRLLEDFSFDFLHSMGELGAATYFDAETYGRDVLLRGVLPYGLEPDALAAHVDDFPLSADARRSLTAFLLTERNVLSEMPEAARGVYLHGTSYFDFLRDHFALPDEALGFLRSAPSGYWGLPAEKLSVAECLLTGLPGQHALGGFRKKKPDERHSPVAMFPDGNSSIARLLVRALIPEAFPHMSADADAHDIVTAMLDYGALDRKSQAVRLRLESTAVHVANEPGGQGVSVSYVQDGRTRRVRADAAVLACYNRIVPHLCPDLPAEQKRALGQCVKRPMLVTNVLLRNGRALAETGVQGVYLPGSMLQTSVLVSGINVGGYRPKWKPGEPCVLQSFSATMAAESPELGIVEQAQASRARLLATPFEDYEREIRRVLNGVYAPGGFDAARDILAITVNRWPHGYARDHTDLEEADWNTEPPPNVIGRRRFGNIAIANSDAGADAYTHTAIDQAWRAVNELAGPA